MLLRCVLDTWDAVYYPLPFVFALLAWEVARPGRAPAACSRSSRSVLAWLSFQWLPVHVSADAQAALFLAWTLPLAARARRVACSGAAASRPTTGRSLEPVVRAGAQETTVSSLDRPLSTS